MNDDEELINVKYFSFYFNFPEEKEEFFEKKVAE
jgi:hypothetical protein